VALPYVQWLSRLGVEARVRTVDPAQFQRLTDTYDYDMIVVSIGESESPGNEQTGYWTCGSVKPEGGYNLMGVCNPVIDDLVQKVVTAPDHAHLVVATRGTRPACYWRAGTWCRTGILQSVRVAYWDQLRTSRTSRSAPGWRSNSWWSDPVRATANDTARRNGP